MDAVGDRDRARRRRAAADGEPGAGRRDRGRLAGHFLADLALNAAWTPLFFRAHRPRAALAEIACLDLANVLLIRQAWRADRTAAMLLVPYAGWTAFEPGELRIYRAGACVGRIATHPPAPHNDPELVTA